MTLHPAIHGGILARRDNDQHLTMAEHHISAIDLVVVNLYPFAETLNGKMLAVMIWLNILISAGRP